MVAAKLLFTFLYFLSFLQRRTEDDQPDRLCNIIMLGAPSIALTIMQQIARLNEKFVDIIGLVYYSTYVISVIIVSATGLVPFDNSQVNIEVLALT